MNSNKRSIRVVVADDSPAALLSICGYLEFAGNFEIVATACDGLDLLWQVDRFRPDLVLTDLSMSGMSGLEAAAALRKSYADMRIIIFSELSGLSLPEECTRHGADTFVEKSNMPDKLMKEVRRLFPQF
jgi:DNA-binding NarL/FixJ family response regulator